jgi:hypothetical protein
VYYTEFFSNKLLFFIKFIGQFKMKTIVRTTLAVSIALALTACNDDKYPVPTEPLPIVPTTPTKLAISGEAIKGTLKLATVELFSADNLFTAIGTTQTDEAGQYTLSVTDEAGRVMVGGFVVKISADDDSTMICDAAVACGTGDSEVLRGADVPAAQLVGLSLSSFTFADSGSDVVPVVNVNSLSTMATDAIIASAALEGSAINLSTLTAGEATGLKIAGSEVVGAILGVDLSAVNLFDLAIVDATKTADVSTTDSIAATLTLINGSLANIEVAEDATMGDSLSSYFTSVETIATAIFADPEVDLAADFGTELTAITAVQADISAESALILTEIEMETGTTIPVEEIPDQVDPEEIKKVIGEIVISTGGTGATGGEG